MSGVSEIRLTIPGQPIAQPRQQTRAVWPGRKEFWGMCREHSNNPDALLNALRRRVYLQNYLPAKHPVQSHKLKIMSIARRKHWGDPLVCPVWMSFVFVFERPQRIVWKRKPMPRMLNPSKPDRDNLEKAVKDALEGIVYKNDSQVCVGPSEKWYAAGDEGPRTEVIIKPIYGE